MSERTNEHDLPPCSCTFLVCGLRGIPDSDATLAAHNYQRFNPLPVGRGPQGCNRPDAPRRPPSDGRPVHAADGQACPGGVAMMEDARRADEAPPGGSRPSERCPPGKRALRVDPPAPRGCRRSEPVPAGHRPRKAP